MTPDLKLVTTRPVASEPPVGESSMQRLLASARTVRIVSMIRTGLQAGFVLFLLLLTVSVYEYNETNTYLRGLIRGLANENAPASEQVIELLQFFRRMPALDNKDYYLLPAFDFLSSTSEEVAEQGGDCADRARLLISLLHMRGIHAVKWALYDSNGRPKHAIVEVDTEKGKMAVDALVGLYFPKPGGGYYSVWDLRRNPQILQDRVHELLARHVQPGAALLDRYPLDEYVYTNARSINWDKSFAMHMTYKLLHALIGSRVDRIPRPYAAERPALLVTFASLFAEIFILLALLICGWVLRYQRNLQQRIVLGSPAEATS